MNKDEESKIVERIGIIIAMLIFYIGWIWYSLDNKIEQIKELLTK